MLIVFVVLSEGLLDEIVGFSQIFSERLHETIERFREADEAPVLSAAPMGRFCCAG